MVGRPNSSAAASHGPLSSNTALDVANTVTRPMYGLSAIFQVVPDTTPPTLTSADVEETNGLTIYLEFSEDLQLSNPPLASAFTLTVDGSAVTGFSVALPGSLLPQNAIWLRPPTAIRQGQAVVVTYTDPTAGNDTAAIQDTTGNDAADFTTGMNSVPAVINNSTVANAVLAGWSLTPTGLAVGDQFRLLFLSSTKRDATATDIATYNTFIQTRAAAGHTDIQAYSAGFRVVGCTAATDARDNTETTYTSTAKGVPIYWLNGAKAADEYEDFYDGSWDDEANDKNESGTDAHDTSQTANWPWTGCNHDGTELRQFAGTVSRGLGTNLADARVGRPNSSTVNHGPLSGLQNRAKTETRPLYGLSALFQVAAAVVVNNPATGAPTITGTAQVGQTLTAATTAIMDDDGLTTPGYTYQWIRVATDNTETNISSATANTYTLVTDDLGTTIKVKVSFTDDASNPETLTSVATAVVSAAANTAPTVANAIPDQAATAGTAFSYAFPANTFSDADTGDTLSYTATKADDTALPTWLVFTAGTRTFSGTPQAADIGTVAVKVTASDGNGGSVSDEFDITVAADPNAHCNALDTSELWCGTLTVGVSTVAYGYNAVLSFGSVAPLTFTHGGATITVNRLLYAGIRFQFGMSSALGAGDFSLEIGTGGAKRSFAMNNPGIEADFFNHGLSWSANKTVPVKLLLVNTPATGAPAITGTAQVGQTLTATVGDIADVDGLPDPFLTDANTSFQWIRVATDNSETDIGAMAGAYTLVADDQGTTIKVKVSFTGNNGFAETRTSAATAAVSAAATAAVVPADWSLKPTAVAAGTQFRLLFLSSTKRNATATDIATYNTFIQTRAAAGHTDIRAYSAGFRVVGCTAAVDARDNTSTTYTATDKGVPIYWLNGAKAADQYEDFYDGSWDDEANDKNESGTNAHDTSQVPNWPLTGCDHDGTAEGALGASQVTVGRPNSSGSSHGPLNGNSQIASTVLTRPMYGLSAVFQVAAAVVVPNNPPAFSADTAARSVAENTAAGQNVGAALTATDADSDTLTYTLEGTDAASFDIVSGSGQIRTRTGVTYNHEAKSTHTVVVKADDGNGGTDTVTVTITVTDVDEPPGQPAAPSVSATAGSTTSLDVTWTAPTNTGPAIASYDLQYRAGTSGNFTNGPQNVTGTSAAIGSLAADTSYEVQVRATNAEGDGDWSVAGTGRTTATSAPGAPTGLTATASGTTAINLSWSAPASTGGSAITGYKIEVSSNGTSGWTDQVANTNSTATTYAHTGLAAGDTRHYRVSAINTNGAGTASTVANATTDATAPGAPTGLTATASGTTAINVSWSAPASTGGSAITGYKIEVSPNGTSGWTDQVANTNSTATTYAHTGLAAGDTRHYRVSAINTNGAGTASNVDSATTGTSVPGAPTGLTATASGTTAINLSWSAPASTGGSAITGYKIESSSDGGSSWSDLVANTSNTTTTYAHTGLTAGDTRHYRVSAINTNGAGTASNVDSATTGTTVPGAPTGLTATASGTTAINLSWSAPASTGGSAITGYKIEVSPNGTSGWTDQVANTNSTATTYAHTGLTAGTTRHYRVSAINTNGAGTASNVDSATTGTTVPGAPTGLTATASETTQIDLSWTAPASTGGSAITGYKIESSSDGGSSWSDLVANTSNTTTTYAHTGLTAGTTRHYRVSAINTNGTGTASTVANATTGQTTVTFGASSYTAAEGGATATVAVQLSAAASATVTIPLTKTHRGGSTAADYSGVPSNVTFTAGQTRRTFTVTATDDADKDGGESVQLGFGTLPAGYAPGARRTATVTLVDDDAILIVNFGTERHTTVKVRESDTVWHRFTFSLSTSRDGPPNGNPQQPVTIPLVVTHRGGATPADYEVRGRRTLTSVTFGVGESVTDFFMRAIPDGKREPGEGLRLDFGPLPPGVRKGTWGPHETIEFVDQVLPGYTVLFGADAYTATEGGADAQVSIHLNEPVEIEPLDVRLLLEYGGGATDADHGRIDPVVTIPVGKQTATITVTATDDTDDDDGERVVLSFVNDPNDRVRVRTGPISATVALADNDGPRRVTVSFGAVTYTATEGGADATVRVALDVAPGRAVTVPLTITDIGGATAEDYSGIPADVTFGADQTAMTFAVTATANDGISDGGESLSIGFGTLPEGVVAGSPTATTVTLADGTEQRLVVNFGSSLGHTVQAREGARRLRLNVLLDSSPRRPVTIPLVVTHVGGATEADYAAIPEIVTFAAGQTSAHYYARALPDEEDETGEGLRLDFGELPPGVRKGTWGPYETIDFVDAGQAANLSVAGPVLTVGYPGALDRGSTPSPRDFVVLTAVPGGEAVIPVTAVAVDGDVVSLALARPVRPDDTVTLSYLADAMHPTRDASGLPAAPLTDEPVRNVTGASDPQAKTRLPAAAPGGVGTGRLDLSSRNLTDVTALAGLTSLRELDLRHNAVTDLWPLAGLTGLQALYLSGNQIADLRPLAGLTGLQVLDLSGNQITDLWPLAELPGLRELDLRDNAVADLRPLESLRGLQALDLSGNQIADLWSLTYLAALERLNLMDNAVADLWPLAERPGLQVLLLDRNRITTVQALSSLAGLANLGLAENRIADLWPLAGLGRLHRLDLAGNAVADVSALGDVSGLVWLRLLGNPVSHALPLGRLAQLRWLWLDAGPAPPR